MKAVLYKKYGGVEVLELANIPDPIAKENQVIVEISAASINAIDWKVRRGFLQKMMPLSFPVTIGGDFAGKIVDAGSTNEFEIGEEVYGTAIVLNGGTGSFAEKAAVNIKNLSKKPSILDMEEAAAFPLVGTSALQALTEHINLQKGQKILIHGGAGGIGHIAIQIARALRGYVIATVQRRDFEFVKRMGAHEVIDYENTSFERELSNLDAVFDTVGGEVTEKSVKVIKTGGILVSMAGSISDDLVTKAGIKFIAQSTRNDQENLTNLGEFIVKHKLNINIDKVFPLEDAPEAFKYQEETHPQGKVVIKIK